MNKNEEQYSNKNLQACVRKKLYAGKIARKRSEYFEKCLRDLSTETSKW
jgi:hypothetical protein